MSIKNENYKQEIGMQKLMEESKKQKATGKKRGRPKKSEFEKLVDSMPFIHKPSVDLETGEINLATIELKEGSVVINKKDQQKQKEQEKYQKSLSGESFVQSHVKYNEIFGKLTQAQLHSLMLLVPYMSYHEKPLKKENHEPLTLTEIYDIWGISRMNGPSYIERFIELGIAEIDESNAPAKYLIIKKNVLFKGEKDFDEFNTKIVQPKMKKVIASVTEQVERYNNDKRRKKKMELYPLALLAVLINRVHFQTFFLVEEDNANEPVIFEEETVEEVLKSPRKKRRIKFLKKNKLWESMTGQQRKSLKEDQTKKLNMYFDMLIKAEALGAWRSGKTERVVMNPNLMYVTPNTYNETWYNAITALFAASTEEKSEKE
ncbi:TPA: hypothetical protein ACLIVI_005308 [Bacillus pacificus]|uniref:hypothetical protein n=1 Tax=Bacillus cereus group TaxID=86661 RepID=UPI001964E218|nr:MULTISPECIES: hypothetical protein [Bacillus cereus group]MCC2341759.1 hypothetical protein [Bacillus tropicus]MCC2495056.1 hypothetical protein [Bacillus cereus]MCQ6524962.1 hypothetical protein [Bacillus paranthracis]MCU5562086.1 hypothetical protein [Bacillus pacificus]MDX5880450.1 hypothetical protein [Bacillus cereus group sp. BfR-BA-01042]